MQKFYITNGKRYVCQDFAHHSKTTTVGSYAELYQYEKARKILLEHKNLDGYYLEGCNDGLHISREQLLKEREQVKNSSKEELTALEIISDIDEIVDNLSSVSMPSHKDLMTKRNLLMDRMQYYDLVLTDIIHWSQLHNPPAHIRTKANTMLHDYRNLRATVKEKIRYIDVLIKFYDSKNNFCDLLKELDGVKDALYVPRTDVYSELDALLTPKKSIAC